MHDLLLGQGILGRKGFDYRLIHEFDELGKEISHNTHSSIKVISWEPLLYKERKTKIRNFSKECTNISVNGHFRARMRLGFTFAHIYVKVKFCGMLPDNGRMRR